MPQAAIRVIQLPNLGSITNITVGTDGKVAFAAKVHDNITGAAPAAAVGKAVVLGKAKLDSDDWQVLAGGLAYANGTFKAADLAATTNRFFKFTVR